MRQTTMNKPKPTKVYETMWRFACERQRIFSRRIKGQPLPWTTDPILQRYRFTNAYRASDRVSQYLIRHVIYRSDLPTSPREILFRVLLFKLFNRIETWLFLEEELGPITLAHFCVDRYAKALSQAKAQGKKLYSAAYIMPSTLSLGERLKHRGHLRLIERMLFDDVGDKITDAPALEAVFRLLLLYPTIGDFLAFQLSIDLNYSNILDFSEMDFIVAGPGAKDGISKCFADLGDYSEADIIRWATDRQEIDTQALGLQFDSLYGRPLQLIDVQNLFCEVGKYARVAHPLVRGTSGRARIKQVYKPATTPLKLYYPPKWGLNDFIPASNIEGTQ